MSDAVPTRSAVAGAVTVTVIVMLMAVGSMAAVDSAAGGDDAWMAPLQQQYGWNTNELKNKVQQGDVTTFELGTPNYQILNPEAEPEFITEDQPHYREMLQRLTSTANASETIDLSIPMPSAGASATAIEEPKTTAAKREKLRKRSFDEVPDRSEDQDEVEAVPLDERSRHPRVQVYAGAKPFQTRIANLS